MTFDFENGICFSAISASDFRWNLTVPCTIRAFREWMVLLLALAVIGAPYHYPLSLDSPFPCESPTEPSSEAGSLKTRRSVSFIGVHDDKNETESEDRGRHCFVSHQGVRGHDYI